MISVLRQYLWAISLLATSGGTSETANSPGCKVRSVQLCKFSRLQLFAPLLFSTALWWPLHCPRKCGRRSCWVAILASWFSRCRTCSTMTLHLTSDSPSILENGRLKPGVYKIQNIQSETYLDVEVHTREVCCRPAKNLAEGRGLVCRSPS